MINLINKDRFIYDLEYRIADIVKYHLDNKKIELKVNAEGICLEKCGFYKLLDYVCQLFNIDKNTVTIYTPNALESHPQYNVVCLDNHWFGITRTSIPSNYIPTKDSNLKNLGCFIGKINWNRLMLGSLIYKNKDKAIFTCHYRHEDAQKLQSELTELNFYDENSLKDAIELMSACPIVLDESFTDYTIGPPEHLTILQHYNKFFTELVIETYVMGNTFFPTEKTLRPIIAETPFIVMGPRNYLQNLKKLGFKTFDRWWDESYDHCEGLHRIRELEKNINKILSWSQEKIQSTLAEMQPILKHNRDLYLNEHIHE